VFAHILLGQAISCYLFGLPLLLFLIRNPHITKRLE